MRDLAPCYKALTDPCFLSRGEFDFTQVLAVLGFLACIGIAIFVISYTSYLLPSRANRYYKVFKTLPDELERNDDLKALKVTHLLTMYETMLADAMSQLERHTQTPLPTQASAKVKHTRRSTRLAENVETLTKLTERVRKAAAETNLSAAATNPKG